MGAFLRHSRYHFQVLDPRALDEQLLGLDAFDALVIHYTVHPNLDDYVAPWLREQIAAFGGFKIQFIQDEYRWVDEMTATMRALGVHLLYSSVPEHQVDKVYGGRLDATEILPTLTGYLPEPTARIRLRPAAERRVDVGYRGRVLPMWLGSLSQEKVEIARGFLARAPAHGLQCDIAWNEHDRLYGGRWARFVASSRCTLATESGASITDFDGSIEARTLAYLDERPAATYTEVHAAVLGPFEGNAVINAVSPRIFEAAVFRTALVGFPGEYSGVIRPDEHYIPLAKDFSNFGEVAERIRDLPALEAMVERAHADLVRSGRYSYEAFVREFDDAVGARVAPRARSGHPQRPAAARRRTRPRIGLEPLGRDLREHLAVLRLLVVDRDLRRLARACYRDPVLRRTVPRQRLEKDLLRLGILRRTQHGQYVTARRFSIEPILMPATGVLVLVSRNEIVPLAADLAGSLREALEARSIREIVWNHREIGKAFHSHSTFRHRRLKLPVGYYGLTGIHEFGALAAVASRHPDAVWAALEPLTAHPAPDAAAPATAWIARHVPRRLGDRVLSWARRRSCRGSTSKQGLPAIRKRLRTGTKRLRKTRRRAASRLSRRFMRLARSSLLAYWCAREVLLHPSLWPLAALALRRPALRSEVLRLVVLRGLGTGSIGHAGGSLRVRAAIEGRSLVMHTEPRSSNGGPPAAGVAEALRSAAVSELVWDNSVLGPHLTMVLPVLAMRPRVSFSVGCESGVYRFTQLGLLAGERADLVLAALGPILEGGPGVRGGLGRGG